MDMNEYSWSHRMYLYLLMSYRDVSWYHANCTNQNHANCTHILPTVYAQYDCKGSNRLNSSLLNYMVLSFRRSSPTHTGPTTRYKWKCIYRHQQYNGVVSMTGQDVKLCSVQSTAVKVWDLFSESIKLVRWTVCTPIIFYAPPLKSAAI